MKKILALLLLLTTVFLLSACGKNEENPSPTNVDTEQTLIVTTNEITINKEKLEKTLTGYFSALKSHDLSEMKHYIDKSLYPNDEEEYKTQFVDTVIDCKLNSVDYTTLKKVDDYRFSVVVNFMIKYSDDYIPVGTRKVGVNNLTEKFIIERENGGNPNYFIYSMSPDLSD